MIITSSLILHFDEEFDGTSDQYAFPLLSAIMNSLSLTLYASRIRASKACLSAVCGMLLYNVGKS